MGSWSAPRGLRKELGRTLESADQEAGDALADPREAGSGAETA